MNSKEFIKALKGICEEKGIKEEVIFEGMTQALKKAYEKTTGLTNIRIDINEKTGDIKAFAYQTVVDEYDEEEENYEDVQILLEDALKKVPNIKVGETIEEEVEMKDFGRVATSSAKQILVQKVREAERNGYAVY